jgi:group II intron reverse transcriptase/maturase
VTKSKPYAISQTVVWEAYRSVKANKGAAGIDGETIAEFERNLKGNLYKLWNRMSSGSYFPPAVRQVEIPKEGGKSVRILGVPTVADRIAQTVVKQYLEPEVDGVFHPDSYGYRPGRSALQAVGVCRERCWKEDWVIDLDIRAFFDTLPHELVMRAVRHHSDLAWIPLSIERWLKAPMQRPDGTLVGRECGSPQGSAISPLLANLFMHYAFDAWMRRRFPEVRFERYCDDVVVHCGSERQAASILSAITERLAVCGLEVNQEKTRIVYCKDDRRRGSHEHERFDVLGYTFRPRRCKDTTRGGYFVGFNPAISDEARRKIGQEIRRWRLHLRSGQSLGDLARTINAVVQGWINYYGRYFPSRLYPILIRINVYLTRWAQRKYKRLRGRGGGAWRFLADVAAREPGLFAHWRLGLRPRAG